MSARLAEARGTVRWELVPEGADAVIVDDGLPGAPVLIFREQAGGEPRLDHALVAAWQEHQPGPQPLDVQEVQITTLRARSSTIAVSSSGR